MSSKSTKEPSDSMAFLEFLARATWSIAWTVIYIVGVVAFGAFVGIVSGIWGGIKDA